MKQSERGKTIFTPCLVTIDLSSILTENPAAALRTPALFQIQILVPFGYSVQTGGSLYALKIFLANSFNGIATFLGVIRVISR